MTVASKTVSNLLVYTLLSSDTLPTLTTTDVITLAYETDTGTVYEWSGGIWNIIKFNGGLVSIPGALSSTYYIDSTYEYIGESLPGTPLGASKWRVKRIGIGDNRVEWANGNGSFDNVMTDLATVALLPFS